MNQDLFIFMVQSAWNSHIKRTDALIDSLTDEQMMQTVSPGRNRVIYLAGHLAAVHDRMMELLELGARKYPELDAAFINNPDGSAVELIPVATIRNAWKETHQNLSSGFSKMKPEQWFSRHTQVSAEDFVKEPHRNKLNLLLSRTDHLAYHLGQMMLAKK
jgi:hypothetical protein